MIARIFLRTPTNLKIFRQSSSVKLFTINGVRSSVANLSTSVATADDVVESTTSVSPKVSRLSEEFRRTFCTPELETLLRSFPPKLLNRKHNFPETLYIAHPKAVDTIAEHLLKDHSRHTTLVEINPGLGLLTDKIIESNVEDIRLYEGSRDIVPGLQVSICGLTPITQY